MTRDTYYLGLATTFHDPALAIVGPGGELVFAEATERPLQLKRALGCEPDGPLAGGKAFDEFIPDNADVVIATSWSENYTQRLTGLAAQRSFQPDQIARRPARVGASLLSDPAERAFIPLLNAQQIRAGLGAVAAFNRRGSDGPRVLRVDRFDHHLTHAAYSAIYARGERATCLVVDGMSESGSVSAFKLSPPRLEPCDLDFGNASPGFFYGLLTDLCGFDQTRGEEWKMMGLAPYGQEDGDLGSLVRGLYRIVDGKVLTNGAGVVRDSIRRIEARRPSDAGPSGWADLALAGQLAFTEIMDTLIATVLDELPDRHLILSGGCALNSAYNGSIHTRFPLDRVTVPPAPADDGNAAGAALLAWAHDHGGSLPDSTASPFLGSQPNFVRLAEISRHEPRLRQVETSVVTEVAELLDEGAIVGWMQGRAELGPRALGNRSILGDPRRADMKDRINSSVKRREEFRPFAPSVLEEFADDWFEDYRPTPFMERTLRWRDGSAALVPAVVHEDGTGRLQSVSATDQPLYHQLISAFYARTGVPLVLNTSLNVMGKPIVHSVEDALLLFHTSDLDALCIGDWLIKR